MFAMLPRAHLVDFHLCLEDFLLCDIVFILFNADHCLLRCSAEVLCEGLRHEAAGQVKSFRHGGAALPGRGGGPWTGCADRSQSQAVGSSQRCHRRLPHLRLHPCPPFSSPCPGSPLGVLVVAPQLVLDGLFLQGQLRKAKRFSREMREKRLALRLTPACSPRWRQHRYFGVHVPDQGKPEESKVDSEDGCLVALCPGQRAYAAITAGTKSASGGAAVPRAQRGPRLRHFGDGLCV